MGFSISYKSMKNLARNSFPRNLSAAFKALKTKFPLLQLRLYPGIRETTTTTNQIKPFQNYTKFLATRNYSYTKLQIKFIKFVAITFHLTNFQRVPSYCKPFSMIISISPQ